MYLTMYVRMTLKGEEDGKEEGRGGEEGGKGERGRNEEGEGEGEEGRGGGEEGVFSLCRVKNISVMACFNMAASFFPIREPSHAVGVRFTVLRNRELGSGPPRHLRRVLWHSVFEGRQFGHVLIVQPLDLEVQVHVVCALA